MEECKKYSKLIEKQLFLSEQYRKAKNLLIYAAYLSEVSTYEIIEQALNSGKKVFCPKVLNPGIMEFYEITSLDDVILGYKNIPEPKVTEISYQHTQTNHTLMVMPLVGFDNHKNRLGYGGGFYDRYLQRYPDMKRIGLGFECQRYEKVLPVEETDKTLDFIITESNIF